MSARGGADRVETLHCGFITLTKNKREIVEIHTVARRQEFAKNSRGK